MMKKLPYIFILIIVLIYFGLKLKTYFDVRSIFPYSSYERIDSLKVTPEHIKIATFNDSDSLYIPVKDLLIPIPNKKIVKDTIYKNGFGIWFSDSSMIALTYDSDIDELDYLLRGQAVKNNTIQKLYSQNNIESNYQYMAYVFHLKPSDISWFDSNRMILIKYSLLRTKQMFLPKGYEKNFLKFQTDYFEGFIFGNGTENSLFIVNGFSNSDDQYSIIAKGICLEELKLLIGGIVSPS